MCVSVNWCYDCWPTHAALLLVWCTCVLLEVVGGRDACVPLREVLLLLLLVGVSCYPDDSAVCHPTIMCVSWWVVLFVSNLAGFLSFQRPDAVRCGDCVVANLIWHLGARKRHVNVLRPSTYGTLQRFIVIYLVCGPRKNTVHGSLFLKTDQRLCRQVHTILSHTHTNKHRKH